MNAGLGSVRLASSKKPAAGQNQQWEWHKRQVRNQRHSWNQQQKEPAAIVEGERVAELGPASGEKPAASVEPATGWAPAASVEPAAIVVPNGKRGTSCKRGPGARCGSCLRREASHSKDQQRNRNLHAWDQLQAMEPAASEEPASSVESPTRSHVLQALTRPMLQSALAISRGAAPSSLSGQEETVCRPGHVHVDVSDNPT